MDLRGFLGISMAFTVVSNSFSTEDGRTEEPGEAVAEADDTAKDEGDEEEKNRRPRASDCPCNLSVTEAIGEDVVIATSGDCCESTAGSA